METIRLYDGMECVNEFSEATNGKDFKKVAEEAAGLLGLSFSPSEPKATKQETAKEDFIELGPETTEEKTEDESLEIEGEEKLPE